MGERIASLMFLLCMCLSVSAKDRPPLVAVVLYQVHSGAAYVELADFAVNGRREMYVCKSPNLTGGEYKHLDKTTIEPGMVLERAHGGALTLTAKSSSNCVLPANLKLDKGRSYSVAELADMAAITGTLAGRSSNAGDAAPTNIQAEMQLHLVAEADTELAEYLRAERANTIELWSNYLRQFPASSRVGDSRKALAKLITDEGDRHFADYRKSQEGGKPRFDELRKARVASQNALEAQKGFVAAERLRLNTDSELYRIVGLARSEFNAYLRAISEHTGGYAHLTQAQSHLQEAYLVDPSYTAAEQLKIAVYTQAQEFNAAVQYAESLLAEKKFDAAYTSVVRYKSFAGEVQRVAAVVDAAFEYHRNLGRQFVNEANWERSIREFQRALECKDDAETAGNLQNAQTELKSLRDKEAALATAAEARALAAKKQYIEAYELLDSLSESQHALVDEDLQALKPQYLQALTDRTKELLRIHLPIRGRADEKAVRQAFDYLENASKLSDNEQIKIKLDQISGKLADYYIKEAKRLLEKPRGSGVGLGWLLLREAEHFKPDAGELRNLMTTYAPHFDSRAKLSLTVSFRDQTSGRNSFGLADQLTDAVVTGLENSGLPGLKAVSQQHRSSDPDEGAGSGPFIANYRVVGSITQHHVDKKIETQSLQSHYRAGMHDVKNPAWLQAKRQVETIEQELERVNQQWSIYRSSNKKKESSETLAVVTETGKKLTDAKKSLDQIPETTMEEIILPYNYTRRTIQLNAVVEISFRISESSSDSRGAMDSVHVEIPNKVIVLENVKPEDVDRVVEEGIPPDEVELRRRSENQASEELLKKLIQRLNEVPQKVIEQARAYSSTGDLEAAAEKYVLYLNTTAGKSNQERAEAQEFLRKEFDVNSLTAQ